VGTAVEQADQHLQRVMKTLGQCGIPADQWNSLGRAGELIDYMRQIQLLSRHGNLTLADPTAERSREFDKALRQLQQFESKLSTAQQATTKWRSKLSAEDTLTALEQARAWQGKLFVWLSPAWWRLRKVLNEAYDFKAHAVRPTWTQVLLALNDEHVAQKEVEQCIAATKDNSAANMSRQG
jgi:hypothetical protein